MGCFVHSSETQAAVGEVRGELTQRGGEGPARCVGGSSGAGVPGRPSSRDGDRVRGGPVGREWPSCQQGPGRHMAPRLSGPDLVLPTSWTSAQKPRDSGHLLRSGSRRSVIVRSSRTIWGHAGPVVRGGHENPPPPPSPPGPQHCSQLLSGSAQPSRTRTLWPHTGGAAGSGPPSWRRAKPALEAKSV